MHTEGALPTGASFGTVLLPNEFTVIEPDFAIKSEMGGLVVFQSRLDCGVEEGLGPCPPCPLGWLQGEREPVCGRQSPQLAPSECSVNAYGPDDLKSGAGRRCLASSRCQQLPRRPCSVPSPGQTAGQAGSLPGSPSQPPSFGRTEVWRAERLQVLWVGGGKGKLRAWGGQGWFSEV